MAIGIQDLSPIDTTDPSNYPNGAIKDWLSSLDSGTPINKLSINDQFLFFDRMLRNSSIVANGLFDNETNGYQYVLALGEHVNAAVAPVYEQLLGADYDATKVYVIKGAATRSANGIAFYNGTVYFVEGNAGPVCGGSLVDILQLQTYEVFGLPVLKVVCGTSGTGVSGNANSNFSGLTRRPFYSASVSLESYNNSGGYDFAENVGNPIKARISNGIVHVTGQTGGSTSISATSSNVRIANLPVGYQPNTDLYPMCLGTISGGLGGLYTNLWVKSNGEIWINQSLGINTGGVFMNFSFALNR